MAQQLKTLPDASRDLISKLPVEIKDKILKCLTTRDAARTALLSTHWNDVWLQHEQLMFDYDFVQGFQQSQDVEGRTLVSIINNILFSRAGPVKKFTLEIDTENDPLPLPQQSDIDRWTIKKLILEGPDIDLPLSACELDGPNPQQSDVGAFIYREMELRSLVSLYWENNISFRLV
nr:F-box/FBD/LRR-repeat protein At1g13570-like [Ipomoea batatas]